MPYAIILFILALAILGFAAGVFLYKWVRRSSAEPECKSDDEVPDVSLPVEIDPSLACSPDPEETKAEEVAGETEAPQAISVSVYANYPTVSDISPDTVELLYAMAESLPRLPTATLDLLPMLSCHGASSKEVANLIEKDQASAARLLRWVNSSVFGLDEKVHTLHRAVTLLGLDTVRSLIIEDSLNRDLPAIHSTGIDIRTIWRHASAVSVISKSLAGSVRRLIPDVAATAGLLHDIGLLLLIAAETGKLDMAVARSIAANEPLIAHEDEVIGFNHQAWGQIFVQAWKLPDEIAISIGSHHSPMREPFNPLTGILWLADYIAGRNGFPCPDGFIPLAEKKEIEELMARIGLQPPLERHLTENLGRELFKATKFWGAPKERSAETIHAS
jgi:HD-like signal output (HDOD) protein